VAVCYHGDTPDSTGKELPGRQQRLNAKLRHAFASNVLDAGGSVDEAQELLGHASVSSTEVYTHPDPARLRAAVDAVPSPRELAGEPR